MSSKEIDTYLTKLPKDKRDTLEKLRRTISAAIPDSEEIITYGMPGFSYKGRPLVAYKEAKNHCAFFVMSNTTLRAFKSELKGYDTDTGTIRFPVGGTLPAPLVKKLVIAKMKELEKAIAK